MKKTLAFILICVLLTGALPACKKPDAEVAPGAGTAPSADSVPAPSPTGAAEKTGKAEDYAAAQRAFAYQLLRACYEKGENALISPVSVQTILALVANGASGQTLEEIRGAALGGLELSAVNEGAAAFRDDDDLKTANSVWLNKLNGFTLTDEFQKTAGNVYNASVQSVPFDDAAVIKINQWVGDHTDGMIDRIIDRFDDPDVVAVLINAIAFDAEWEEPFPSYAVYGEDFTCADGSVTEVDMMNGETYGYIDDGKATGFIKRYKGGKYAFAALLPNEGVTPEDYIAGLDETALENRTDEKVRITMPKFKTDCNYSLADVMKSLGMVRAFSAGEAEFDRLGRSAGGETPYLSKILHKTHIDVFEEGTKAAAVTAATAVAGSAMPTNEPKRVILNRPFVYMILDIETNAPVFLGVANTLTGEN